MNLDEFYQKVISMMPIVHDNDQDVRDLLKDKLNEYVALIDALEAKWLLGNKTLCVQAAKDISAILIECFDYVYSGNRFKAYQLLEQEQRRRSFIIPTIEAGKSLYRMRKREPNKRFTHKDMCPIPLSKRYLVQTQRYSMPGQPCLYLGVTPYTCWEEMHRPPVNDCMVSRYEVIKPFNVLSLVPPSLEEFKSDYINSLRYFPMILASMITVKDYTHPFKAAYIIPQLLMEWITTTEEAEERDIKGIFYTSVHLNDELGQPLEHFNNLALPLPGPKHSSNLTSLNDIFKLTDPTCDDYLRIKYGNTLGDDAFKVKDGYLIYTTQGAFDDIQAALAKVKNFPLHVLSI